MLHSRFKKFLHIVINALIREKYIIRNAINRRESREYVQKLFRFVKNVELTQLRNQLDVIYNNIELKIRQFDIRRFKNDISLNDFLSNIDNVKYN